MLPFTAVLIRTATAAAVADLTHNDDLLLDVLGGLDVLGARKADPASKVDESNGGDLQQVKQNTQDE